MKRRTAFRSHGTKRKLLSSNLDYTPKRRKLNDFFRQEEIRLSQRKTNSEFIPPPKKPKNSYIKPKVLFKMFCFFHRPVKKAVFDRSDCFF